jgi:hypothetical protein
MSSDPLSRKRQVRAAYLIIACVAFGLAVVTGDALIIACGGFILIAALLGALIATRLERLERASQTGSEKS